MNNLRIANVKKIFDRKEQDKHNINNKFFLIVGIRGEIYTQRKLYTAWCSDIDEVNKILRKVAKVSEIIDTEVWHDGEPYVIADVNKSVSRVYSSAKLCNRMPGAEYRVLMEMGGCSLFFDVADLEELQVRLRYIEGCVNIIDITEI